MTYNCLLLNKPEIVLPKIYVATDHDIDPALIDQDALSIIKRLREEGFTAYLVGGSVRDLLIHQRPKDFDISTSAKPEELKQIFRRQCLLIGRRFRLAHIRFGHKVIEVSTFRSGDNDSDLIIRDNQWGTPEEDVIRRDFTINGLFYDPAEHKVIDYVGGWNDIHQRILRSIGDPQIRFRQDPVRMIRLVKFRARFNFTIEDKTKAALLECREEIVKSAPARILEEVLRMLESGYSVRFFHLMSEANLLGKILPFIDQAIRDGMRNRLFGFLSTADKMNLKADKPLDRAILTACLFYPLFERELQTHFYDHQVAPNMGEVLIMTNSLLHTIISSSFSHFPRRLSTTVAFILVTQFRLTPQAPVRHLRHKIAHCREFPLALHLLKIRAMIDPELIEAYSNWQAIWRQYSHQADHRKKPHPAPDIRRRRINRRRREISP